MINMEKFCGENFIIIQDHKFGKCFEQLCIIYPTFCFLLISSAYFIAFRHIRHANRASLEFIIIIMRICVSLIFCAIEFYSLFELYFNKDHRISSDLIEAIIKTFTWAVHIVYLISLIKGITYKIRGPLSVNVCIALCFGGSLLHLYMQIREHSFYSLNKSEVIIFVCQIIYVLTLLPNECFRDGDISENSINSINPEEEPLLNSVPCHYSAFHEESDPEHLGTAEEVNAFSWLFLTWVKPLMIKGYCNHLKTIDDLYDLPLALQTNSLSEKSRISNNNNLTNFEASENKYIHLLKELHKLFGWEFYLIGILKLMSDCLLFGGPLLLNALVSNLEDDEKKNWKYGYYYALGLFLTTFLGSFCSTHYNYLINRISLKIKASLIMIIYQKTLLTSKVTLSCMNTGEILNFISTDTDRIVNFCQSFHQSWSLPIQVIVTLIFLYQLVNYCFLIGIAFIIIVIPINHYIAKKIANYSTFLMFAKDKRIKLMNEILCGIRTIKMNTWEQIFSAKLKVARNNEVKYLKKRKYLDALCVYFWATTPVMMSFLTFTLYSSLGYELTAAKVFTSISLFNILIMPLNAFPWVLNGLMEAWVSLKRVNSFLRLPNSNFLHYYSEPSEQGIKLQVTNGVFSYKDVNHENIIEASRVYDSNNTTDISTNSVGPISFKVSEGEFVCVIGKVGSGKTSLLSCILADMSCISGEIKMSISDRKRGIGYVSQNPWIQQKSIKDNILFGKAFNSKHYRNVLESCALIEDLKCLPYGDNTKVGDKGVTLSGGQKARLALARAVYQDYDIYLLDDPLSAVDAHVADHIFSNCIMGMLKNKTRILCTHKTKFAENANYVLFLSDGKIVTEGPPNQTLQLYFMNDDSEFISDEFENLGEILKETIPENKTPPEECEETKEEGVVKFHVYKSYWRAIGSALSIAVLIFCFLMQASKTISDWWLSYWISNSKMNYMNLYHEFSFSKNHTDKKHSLTFYLSVYGGLAGANSIFALFRAFLFAIAGIKAAVVLHDKLLNNIMKAKTYFFDITPLGRIINRFSSDIYCIDDTLPFVMNILLAQVFSLVGCVIITWYGLPWILVLILVLSVIYFKMQNYYRCTSRELKRLSSISLSPIYAHFSETLTGHTTIRALASCTQFQRDNMDYIDNNIRTVLATTAASQWLNLRLQFIGVIIVTGVSLIALIQREFDDIDAGLIGLALSYALSITSLLNGSITAFTETEKEIVSVERVVQYIEDVETESNTYLQLPPFAWPSHGVIAFVKVSLQYRPTCPYALKNVTFETRPGEKIGIVGRTGSGKSSLIQILCRMVNSFEGIVFVDGVNIANLELKRLRSSLSVIPQDPFLFSGSVRENLDPNYIRNDTEIWKALRHCHMEEKLQNLGGLDVRIEEMGQNFSNGERQLICLARALLQRAKILCLDEATASIDYQTDSLIRHTVRMVFRHSTVLIIAHRMETVMDCDRVIVMKCGEIVEFDKPSNLLSDSKSEFYGLVYPKIV